MGLNSIGLPRRGQYVLHTKRKVSAKFGMPSKAEIKKNFKKTMARFTIEISAVENSQLRDDLLKSVQSNLEIMTYYKNVYELIDFVMSATDHLEIGIATGLYGLLDPRTQKLADRAEEREMDQRCGCENGQSIRK
jgi:hypothetical protein